MLAHTITNFRPGRSSDAREVQDAAVWAAIEAALKTAARLPTSAVARHIGLSVSSTRDRLLDLRQLGEVRMHVVGTRGCTWSLGAEPFAERAEKLVPLLTRAQQLGTFQRDPLVAALFGGPAVSSSQVAA